MNGKTSLQPKAPQASASFFAVPPPATRMLAVIGRQEQFPVNRIFCVGRNYADHAREMGHNPEREPPFFFMKPASALLPSGHDMRYPSLTSDLQHEVELVVALGQGGSNIPTARALDHVFGYAVGLDMTRRDLQREAKDLGRPWETGKGFDQSAPCSALASCERIGHPSTGTISLEVNGRLRQRGDLSQMIWSVSDTLAHLSTLFTLEPGDLIYTGTPAGVSAVVQRDVMTARIDGVGELIVQVV